MSRYIIAGPSHVVRMQHAFNCNLHILLSGAPVFIGMGGAPTWSESILRRISDSLLGNEPIYYISGDFRFGNSIIEDGLDIDCAIKVYNNVNASFLSELNDIKMYNFYLRGMDTLISKFRTIKIIPWTLLMRRANNILNERHVNELGIYSHPIYDEKALIEKYSSNSYVKCLNVSPNILSQFYIDNDLHPSTLGYMFLSRCIANEDPYHAVHHVVEHLIKCINSFLFNLGIVKKINIVGNSSALSTLKKVLPIECGLHNVIAVNDKCNDDDILINLLSLEDTKKINSLGQLTFPWDYLGYTVISERHPDLKRLEPERLNITCFHHEEYFYKFEVEDFFDIGEKLTPTLKGLLFILSLASEVSEIRKMSVIEETIKEIFLISSSNKGLLYFIDFLRNKFKLSL